MKVIRGALQVARAELALVHRFPRLRWVLPAIIIIPAIYAFVYLDSVWDPASRTGALPVAIVNLDQGATVGPDRLELGQELLATLQTQRTFAYTRMAHAEEARESVRSGRHVFALVIPHDFSAAAIAPARPGAGNLVVFASEGNNYVGAGFARRFASELGHQVNEALNERRWALVLGRTADSRDQLRQWREGVDAVRLGSIELERGLGRLRDATAPLSVAAARLHDAGVSASDSLRQTTQAAQALEARKPLPADFSALKEGFARLNGGHAELQRGLGRLESGAAELNAGLLRVREDVAPIPLLGDKALEITEPLLEGATALRAGSRLSREASAQLSLGLQELGAGVSQLTDGMVAFSTGASSVVARLPAEDRLQEWTQGSRALAEGLSQAHEASSALHTGSSRLAGGMNALLKALPATLDGPQGSAGGLAATVEPRLEIDAPVPNNGMGFLPNFIPVALWLGAVMTAFVFHLRRVPSAFQGHSSLSLLWGKMLVLGAINLAQAGCVLLMCQVLLGLQPVNATGLALTMACSGLTFMLLILLLVRLLGDAGKGAALMLLIVQLSAAGGVIPIELSSEFYASISPWMPFTWSVKAVRASAFGGFGAEWGSALLVLSFFALVFAVLAQWMGRWRFVGLEDHQPAMDL